MANMQDRPTITDYPLSSRRTPVHLRDPNQEDFDQTLRDKRNADPSRYIDEMKHCTFSPNLNSRSKSRGRRNEQDLLNWGQEKRFKQTNARLKSMMGDQCSFSPNINARSRQLAGQRYGPVHKRLHNAGADTNEKLEQLK